MQFVRFLLVSLFAAQSTFAAVPEKTQVLIIGAGLSGLATAYNLKKAGVKYHILEIGQRIGGRVRTVRYRRPGEPEIYADSGMEEYWESNPAVQVMRELKLPFRSDVAVSSIALGGKVYELGDEEAPEFYARVFSEKELKSLQEFKDKVKPIIAQIHSKPDAKLLALKDLSFAQWVKNQKVPQKVAEWIRVSVECEIGTAWDRISALDGISEFHIFLGQSGQGEMSFRVIGGNDQFTDGIAKNVGLGNISLSKRVQRVTSKGDKVQVTYLDSETNVNGVIEASHVVSTIPLYRLFEVQFDPPISEKKRQAIASQSWGAYFKVHVFVPPSAEKYWIKNENSILPILSDSELGVIYDGNPDQEGKTRIVSLLTYGDHAERFNMMPMEKVRETIKAGFDKLWPGFSKEIKDMEFYRLHPRAIAAWPVGRSRYDDLSNEIRRPENRVYFAGDHTESSHSDGAFISASRVANQIIAIEGK